MGGCCAAHEAYCSAFEDLEHSEALEHPVAADPVRSDDHEDADGAQGDGVTSSSPSPTRCSPRSSHGAEAVTAAWRRQALAVIRSGAADFSAGLGSALSSLYAQRSFWSDAVLAFMFQDRPEAQASTPKACDRQDTTSTDAPRRAKSWPTWPSWSSESGPARPRSVRLRQRCGKAVEVQNGTEAVPSSATAEVTTEVMHHGDLEVLFTRQNSLFDPSGGCTTKLGGNGTDAKLDTPCRPGKQLGASIMNCGLSAQFPAEPWLFRALVDGFMNGPLTGLVDQGVCGEEALHGLAQAWPGLSTFLGRVVKVPEVSLHAKQTKMGCVRVDFSAPVDLKAMMVQYPSVAKLLGIFKSLRLRLTDMPLSSSTAGPPARSAPGARQVGWLTLEDGELFLHFLLHGRHVAWADLEDMPIVEDGKVAVLEEPIGSLECPQPKGMTVYWCIDNLRLRLSEFGCIGISSLAMPNMTLKVDVMTAPLGSPEECKQGSDVESEGSTCTGQSNYDSRRDHVVADIVVRMVDMSAFPAEALVRPLFDVKLMRSLLVQRFGMAWSLRPASKGNGWQLLTGIQVSFPKVAKAFRMCFKVFAQKQLKESDWLGLLANVFSALADDLRSLEGEAAAEKLGAAD